MGMKKIFYILIALISINLANAQKKVLVEYYTNTYCSACASASRDFNPYHDANEDKMVLIKYHTRIPYDNDSFYYANKPDGDYLRNKYTISGTPSVVINGTNVTHPFSLYGSSSTLLNDEYKKNLEVGLGFHHINLNGNVADVMVMINDSNNILTSDDKLFVAGIEKFVNRNEFTASPGSNTETTYEHVLRRYISDIQGDDIDSSSAMTSKSYMWTADNVKNADRIGIVVYIQNTKTKEVKAAEIKFVEETSSINNAQVKSIDIFPNPAQNNVSISIPNLDETVDMRLIDATGRTISVEKINANNNHQIDIAKLEPGIYTLQINAKNHNYIGKFFKY